MISNQINSTPILSLLATIVHSLHIIYISYHLSLSLSLSLSLVHDKNEHDGRSQNVEGMNGEQMQEIKSQGKTLENDVNKQNLGDNVSLTMTLLMFKAPEIASFNGTKEVNRKKRSFKV